VDETNEAWFSRARKVIPGGVDSPVRSFSSVGGTPYTVVRGDGPYVYDVEGKRYIDLVQSYGAVLLGHGHPVVTSALAAAAMTGTSFGAPTEGEVRLAETICGRVPGCEQVRLVSSGTEAAMSAVRVARGYTGRDRILKFEGCYHGHADALLAGAGSGLATLGVPLSAVADTLVVPYNVVPLVDETVACVIVEVVAANMGLVGPLPGFIEGLRKACDEAGALLIFDEVITGFRLGPGGASVWSGVRPDLWCFGKVIGGGLPVGAFGGSRESMSSLAPLGPVYQAGTLSGNPLATVAGTTVLNLVTPEDYKALAQRVATFALDLETAIASSGLFARCPTQGPLMGLYLAREPFEAPRNFVEAKALCENGLYPAFFHAMLDRGVALAPGAYEILFVSMAHSVEDLAAAVAKAAEAAEIAARS
jgi:glutamate-1-semialdehyde 2,1-aminomutase